MGFVTPEGKYEWNQIQMGHKNQANFFHCVILKAFKNINGVAVFVDDITTYSKSEEKGITTEHKVLKRLK